MERRKRNSDFPERERTQGGGDTSTPFILLGWGYVPDPRGRRGQALSRVWDAGYRLQGV